MADSPKKYTMPSWPIMRDQAAARGEPVPVGKMMWELRMLGWDVGPEHVYRDLRTLVEDSESPTGYAMVWRGQPLRTAMRIAASKGEKVNGHWFDELYERPPEKRDAKRAERQVMAVAMGQDREILGAWMNPLFITRHTAAELQTLAAEAEEGESFYVLRTMSDKQVLDEIRRDDLALRCEGYALAMSQSLWQKITNATESMVDAFERVPEE